MVNKNAFFSFQFLYKKLCDLLGDGIPDIVAAHTDERENVREGHIKLISGKTGKIFRSIPSPYNEEIFVP